MLTHREILSELRRIGIKDASMLKTYLKDFELYMQVNHGADFEDERSIAGYNGFKFSFGDGSHRQKRE